MVYLFIKSWRLEINERFVARWRLPANFVYWFSFLPVLGIYICWIFGFLTYRLFVTIGSVTILTWIFILSIFFLEFVFKPSIFLKYLFPYYSFLLLVYFLPFLNVSSSLLTKIIVWAPQRKVQGYNLSCPRAPPRHWPASSPVFTCDIIVHHC